MEKPASADNNGLKKGPWSEEEDEKLRTYIQRYGIWNWRLMPKYAGLSRCGKSCRLRWVNYLKPGVKRGSFTKEEEDLIIELHAQLGNKWSTIASKLSGRTDNEIKNFWHTRFGKARRHNHPVPEEINASHTTNETSDDDRELNEDKSQESTLCEMGQNESISFDGPSSMFDTTPSLFSVVEPDPVDAWPDSFLADTATYGQNEFYPPLPGEDSFYPEFNYGGLSSLGETSYLSDQPNLWSEPFESNAWSSQTQSSYNYFTGEGMGGVSYDPSIEYFDHGMDLFSSN